ncbi:hypothetical protein MTQ16_03195 [Corynebacterium bovis]
MRRTVARWSAMSTVDRQIAMRGSVPLSTVRTTLVIPDAHRAASTGSAPPATHHSVRRSRTVPCARPTCSARTRASSGRTVASAHNAMIIASSGRCRAHSSTRASTVSTGSEKSPRRIRSDSARTVSTAAATARSSLPPGKWAYTVPADMPDASMMSVTGVPWIPVRLKHSMAAATIRSRRRRRCSSLTLGMGTR